MPESFGILAHHYESFEQVQGWLVSRKFNGWSAIWDGGLTRDKFAEDVPWYYKGGDRPHIKATGLWSLGRENKPKVLHAPSYFLDALPVNIPLHGELWYNDRLDIIKSVCSRSTMFHPMWQNIKFIAFNIKPYCLWPMAIQINLEKLDTHANIVNTVLMPYYVVIDYIQRFKNDVVWPLEVVQLTTTAQLESHLMKAKRERWEGLCFANPLGTYELKRSHNVLKWKSAYETEATVVGYEPGKTGKNIGLIGALQVSLTWDDKVLSVFGGLNAHKGKTVEFCISGLTDIERHDITTFYPKQSKVKFTYNGVSVHGVPQSPNIYRGM